MTTSEKYNTLKKACEEQRFCEIHCNNELKPKLIQPFGICLTFKRGLIIVALQIDDHNKNSTTDQVLKLRNFPLENCDRIKVLENKFNIFPGFHQHAQECSDWLFHVDV